MHEFKQSRVSIFWKISQVTKVQSEISFCQYLTKIVCSTNIHIAHEGPVQICGPILGEYKSLTDT